MGTVSVDELIENVAQGVKDLPDVEIASRIVGLLIHDQGNLNKYQRTIELSLRIYARVLELRRGE